MLFQFVINVPLGLPTAKQLRAVHSIDEAMKRIASDKALAIEVLNLCSEEELETKPSPAPWDPNTFNLGLRLLQMIDHLNQHNAQLFYYLKLQANRSTPSISTASRRILATGYAVTTGRDGTLGRKSAIPIIIPVCTICHQRPPRV